MKKIFILFFIFFFEIYALSREEILKISSYFQCNLECVREALSTVDTSTIDGKFKRAILLSAIGVKTKDNKATSEAINILEKYIKKNKDAFAIAYLGMNYALVARYDKNPSVKTRWGNKAIKTLNESVKLKSNEWYIRFLRGNVLFEFPEFFGVTNTVKDDFLYLEKLIEKDEITDIGVLISVYYFLGEIYKMEKSLDKAIMYWRKSVELSQKNRILIDEAQNAMKRLELFAD